MKKLRPWLTAVLIFVIAWLIPSPLSGLGRGETESKVQAIPMETAAPQHSAPEEDRSALQAGAAIELPAEQSLPASGLSAEDGDAGAAARAVPESVPNDETPAEETVGETAEPSDEEPAKTLYILNKNSHKFHYPDCSSVGDMADKNKEEFYGDREELIEMGYSPCGRCKP